MSYFIAGNMIILLAFMVFCIIKPVKNDRSPKRYIKDER